MWAHTTVKASHVHRAGRGNALFWKWVWEDPRQGLTPREKQEGTEHITRQRCPPPCQILKRGRQTQMTSPLRGRYTVHWWAMDTQLPEEEEICSQERHKQPMDRRDESMQSTYLSILFYFIISFYYLIQGSNHSSELRTVASPML